jgi:hypothetical protein
MSKPGEIRTGMTDETAVRAMQRPLEIDLEAVFAELRDDALRELLRAVKEGASPEQAIRRVIALLEE